MSLLENAECLEIVLTASPAQMRGFLFLREIGKPFKPEKKRIDLGPDRDYKTLILNYLCPQAEMPSGFCLSYMQRVSVMFAGVLETSRGDVVASGASVYVVFEVESDSLTVLRIENQTAVRHRADVIPDHWSDLALSGLPLQDIVIRCVPVRRYGTCNLTKLGCLSETLQERLGVALMREMQVRRFEDSPPMHSNLLASTSSRGRRVGAVRYV